MWLGQWTWNPELLGSSPILTTTHSRPHGPFVSLSRLGLGTRKQRALGTQDFQSQILGLPVFMDAVMTFQKNVWESCYVFDFRLGILCSKQPIKKIRINSKILCPQNPPFSRANPANIRETKGLWGRECREVWFSTARAWVALIWAGSTIRAVMRYEMNQIKQIIRKEFNQIYHNKTLDFWQSQSSRKVINLNEVYLDFNPSLTVKKICPTPHILIFPFSWHFSPLTPLFHIPYFFSYPDIDPSLILYFSTKAN